MRLLWRYAKTLHVCPFGCDQIPETHLRPHARPESPAYSWRDRYPHIVPHVFSGIEVPRVDYEKLNSDRLRESSASIRERVQAARERQRVRFEGTDIVCPVQEPGLPQFRHARGGSSQIL